jgi:hypothetical protein
MPSLRQSLRGAVDVRKSKREPHGSKSVQRKWPARTGNQGVEIDVDSACSSDICGFESGSVDGVGPATLMGLDEYFA